MQIDYLVISQEHDFELPVIGEYYFDAISKQGEYLGKKQPPFVVEGSHSTKIVVRVRGGQVEVEGNPSRINRLDNLFGYTDIDSAVSVFNQILLSIGLPPFTKCTNFWRGPANNLGKHPVLSDGAKITRIDICENVVVGAQNENDYIRGVATQRLRNSIPFLYPDGNSVDWKSKKGGTRLIYSKVYNKSVEMETNLLPKIRKLHGETSEEYKYVCKLIRHLKSLGVVRFEQEYKSEYLKRNGLSWWGKTAPIETTARVVVMHDEIDIVGELVAPHQEFLSINDKLKVTAMDIESISERLLREKICETTKAANTTAMYVMQWRHGQVFDLKKSQVQTHRARLRKIGIDIANPCDIQQFSPVFIRNAREVVITSLEMPDWYKSAAVQPLLKSVA